MADITIVLSVIISNINAAAVYFILAIISGLLLFLSCLLGQWLSTKLSPVYPAFPPTMPPSEGSRNNTQTRTNPTLRKQWTKDFLGQTYTQCKGVDCCSSSKLSKDLFQLREDGWCFKDSRCCDRPEMCAKNNDMAESLSGVEEDYQYSVCPGQLAQLHHNADTLEVTQPQWKFYRLTDGRRETLV